MLLLEPTLRTEETETADPQPPPSPTPPPTHEPLIGAVIAERYKVLGAIGEGGFGVVYEAEQQHPVRRRVALKVIKPGMDSKSVVARFEAERQALAVMDHPAIAKVFDAGTTGRGLPFFVMELVKGEPITGFCDKNRLSIDQRLELMIRVAQAVQHAHAKGVIHRDLKPSNVLVYYDAEGRAQPKVIDFGVAKALNQRLSEQTLFTDRGHLIGTPEYMSPEQAEMGGTDIDTRADVYSLGVMLYELLTGFRPFDLQRAAIAEMQRVIRETEPPKPSTRLASVLTGRSTSESATRIVEARRSDPRELTSVLRRDLDWVVMRSLEKDRERRYDTANALAAELRRYLNGEPVDAGPPSTAYRLRKLARRNRGPVIGAAAVFAALVLGIIGTGIGLVRAEAEAERARLAEVEQKRLAQTEAEARKLAEKQTEETRLQRAEAERQRDNARWRSWIATAASEFADHADMRMMILREAGPNWGDEFSIKKSIELSFGVSHRLTTLTGHNRWVVSAAWSPDGARIVTASTDNTARVWRADGAGEPLVLGHDGSVISAAWSPDGERIVTASVDNTARVWRADGAGEPLVLGHDSWVYSAAWSPDGERIVTASRDNTARVWTVDWPRLRDHLWELIPDVLAPRERIRYLGETEEEAQATYERQKAERGARLSGM